MGNVRAASRTNGSLDHVRWRAWPGESAERTTLPAILVAEGLSRSRPRVDSSLRSVAAAQSRGEVDSSGGAAHNGYLMNRVHRVVDLSLRNRIMQAIRELKKIQRLCHWTGGVWEELDRLRWDHLGKNRRDVNPVSNSLIRAYLMK